MPTLSLPDRVIGTDQQRDHARSLIRRALCEASAANEDRIVAITVQLGVACDPLSWLTQRVQTPCAYWRARWSADEYAAAGSVQSLQLSGDDSLSSALSMAASYLNRIVNAEDLPDTLMPRFFGGGVFDTFASNIGEWAPFGDCTMNLPEAMLCRTASGVQLVLMLRVSPAGKMDQLLQQLGDLFAEYTATAEVAEGRIPHGTLLNSGPTAEQWHQMVTHALQAITHGPLQKVVLSREVRWNAADAVPVWSLVRQLRDSSDGSYCFAFQPDREVAFVSVTPERLVRIAGRDAETDCIAGTVPRDPDPTKDEKLAEGLLASGKDRREHAFVVEGVVEALRDLCINANVGAEPWTVQLPTVQHLVTTASGQLRAGVSTSDVVTRLHPTPAVGGSPRLDALAEIRKLEHTGRGWYGGPVGWISKDGAEFAVGIRSGLIRGQSVRVFAGAGIVAGSSPEREWDETELKVQSLLKMLPH